MASRSGNNALRARLSRAPLVRQLETFAATYPPHSPSRCRAHDATERVSTDGCCLVGQLFPVRRRRGNTHRLILREPRSLTSITRRFHLFAVSRGIVGDIPGGLNGWTLLRLDLSHVIQGLQLLRARSGKQVMLHCPCDTQARDSRRPN